MRDDKLRQLFLTIFKHELLKPKKRKHGSSPLAKTFTRLIPFCTAGGGVETRTTEEK